MFELSHLGLLFVSAPKYQWSLSDSQQMLNPINLHLVNKTQVSIILHVQ